MHSIPYTINSSSIYYVPGFNLDVQATAVTRLPDPAPVQICFWQKECKKSVHPLPRPLES